MQNPGRFPALAFALLLVAPAAVAGYSSPQYRQAEPSTTYDVDHMFDETDALSGDHAYLNGFPTIYAVGPSPTLTDADSTIPPQMLYFNALMGFWRDCNGDGFIGSALLGSEVYPVSLLPNFDICPPGEGPTANAFYVNPAGDGFVNEFLWIGPDYYVGENDERTNEAGHTSLYGDTGVVGPSFEERNDPRNVNDQDARVWADFGLPNSTPTATPVLFPFPKGSLQTWERNLGLVDLHFGVNETLGPYGLSYDTVLGVGRTLDSNNVPTPLGIAKNLYNSSTEPDGGEPGCGRTAENPCEGAYAQPFIVVWDCQNADKGTSFTTPFANPATGEKETVHVAPPVSPGTINTNGSWGGTYYQLGRGLGYDDHDGDGTPECDDAAHGGAAGRVYGYWNLERTAEGGGNVQKKASTDVNFYYYPKSRFHEAPEGDSRRGSDGNVTVPYTGLVDGADRHAGTGYGSFYFRGWKAGNYHVFTPSATHPLGALGALYGTSTVTFYGYSSLTVGKFPTSGQYGQEHCTDGFGPNKPGDGTWDCDPDGDAWQAFYDSDPDRNVVVSQPFNTRDVDCYDNTFAGFTTPRVAGGSDCASRGLAVN